MEKVRFTVAISAYNIENYVKRAIDSVLNQTFKNYELLVIDDCSTDSTVEVIKQVVGQNAKILQTKKNSGTAALKWGAVGFTTGAIAGAAIGAGAGLIKNKNFEIQAVGRLKSKGATGKGHLGE